MCFCNLNKFMKCFMLFIFVIFLQINLNFSVFVIRLTIHFTTYDMRFTIEEGLRLKAVYNRENTVINIDFKNKSSDKVHSVI